MTVTVDETRGALSTNVVYTGSDGRQKAAIVTAVNEDGTRNLQVFSNTGRVYPKSDVPQLVNEESCVCWL